MSDPFEPDDESAPHIDIAALLEEIPLLYRARAFADAMNGARFLQRLGEPLDGVDRILAQSYLDGLGFPDARPAILESWEDATAAAESLDLNTEGWEVEEALRASVTQAALDRLDEGALHAALTIVADKAGEAARDAIDEAAAIWDLTDAAFLNAAAGAAVQSAHLATLALLASDEEDPESDELLDHPFMAKFRLFARGRWPVGLAGRTLNVF